jgi:type VI secretion system activator RovC-like protein
MPSQSPHSPVDDVAPTATVLTSYDARHAITYLRLLDAEAEGADWQDVARIVLHIDPAREPERAHRAWESHLARGTTADSKAIIVWNRCGRIEVKYY